MKTHVKHTQRERYEWFAYRVEWHGSRQCECILKILFESFAAQVEHCTLYGLVNSDLNFSWIEFGERINASAMRKWTRWAEMDGRVWRGAWLLEPCNLHSLYSCGAFLPQIFSHENNSPTPIQHSPATSSLWWRRWRRWRRFFRNNFIFAGWAGLGNTKNNSKLMFCLWFICYLLDVRRTSSSAKLKWKVSFYLLHYIFRRLDISRALFALRHPSLYLCLHTVGSVSLENFKLFAQSTAFAICSFRKTLKHSTSTLDVAVFWSERKYHGFGPNECRFSLLFRVLLMMGAGEQFTHQTKSIWFCILWNKNIIRKCCIGRKSTIAAYKTDWVNRVKCSTNALCATWYKITKCKIIYSNSNQSNGRTVRAMETEKWCTSQWRCGDEERDERERKNATSTAKYVYMNISERTCT